MSFPNPPPLTLAAALGLFQPLNSTLTALSGKALTGSGDIVLATAPTLTNPAITGGSITNTPAVLTTLSTSSGSLVTMANASGTQDIDVLALYHNKTGAGNDTAGLSFDLNNSAAARVAYGRINLVNTGNTAGAEDGTFIHSVRKAGVLTEFMRLRGGQGIIFNELAGDIDVRFESVANPNFLFLDASTDFIGVRNGTPSFNLDVTGTFRATTSVNTATVTASGTVSGLLLLAQTSTAGAQVVGQIRNTDTGATSTTRFTWGNGASANFFNLYTTNSTHASYPSAAVLAIGGGGQIVLEQASIPALVALSTGNFLTASSAVTNNPNVVQTIRHNSTGTPTTNFGTGLAFELSSSTTANQRAATIDAVWQDATHASRIGNLVFNVYSVSTKTPVLTLTPTGAGFGTSSPQGMLQTTASDAGTNTVLFPLYIERLTTGTAANNIGVGVEFRVETDGGSTRQSARLRSRWTTAADATRVADLNFDVYNASGAQTVLTLTPTSMSILDAVNIALGTTTGTKIGTAGGAAGQKLGFFNATPIVQPLLATGAGATVDNVITALQNLGLVRQS